MAEFTDGSSHTVLFSERSIGDRDPAVYTPWTDSFAAPVALSCRSQDVADACRIFARNGDLHDSWQGTNWLLGGLRHTWYNHVLTPNCRVFDCNEGVGYANGAAGAYTARSYHSGTVNVSFADGSARPINDQIAEVIWRAMATRNGAEVLAYLH